MAMLAERRMLFSVAVRPKYLIVAISDSIGMYTTKWTGLCVEKVRGYFPPRW